MSLTTLVVGCDRGIAHAAAVQLHARGDHVIAACLADGDDLKQRGIAFRSLTEQMDTTINTIGPLRTVEAHCDLLGEGSKVGIVSSRVGSLGDNGSGGMYAYRISKAAANMVGLNLHHDLSPRGVSVIMLHPGMVATALTAGYPGDHAYIQPEEAAAGLVRNMDELTPQTSGRFRHANGTYLPW